MQVVYKMKIGLIDVDNYKKLDKCFPNLPLMKLSAWHKMKGDEVGWYDGTHCDLVYCSKVFSFSKDFPDEINATKVLRGGSGYFIDVQDGIEVFNKEHFNLPDKIEHIFPDYSLYGIKDTAYGFMSRGCPRGCSFCHVEAKEGRRSMKVADLNEFWNGQSKIEVLDPNTFACKDWKDILQQLIDSGAWINFNQGVDIRVLNDEKIEYLKKVKLKHVHFAWDRYEDKEIIVPRLQKIKEVTGWDKQKVTVYILTNFDTTMEQNVERVEFVRSLGFCPYVTVYDKEHVPRGSEINKLSRWANWKQFIWKIPTFEEYKRLYAEGRLYGKRETEKRFGK